MPRKLPIGQRPYRDGKAMIPDMHDTFDLPPFPALKPTPPLPAPSTHPGAPRRPGDMPQSRRDATYLRCYEAFLMGHSLGLIAKRYPVSHQTVHSWATEDHWEAERNAFKRNCLEAVREKLRGLIVGHAVDHVSRELYAGANIQKVIIARTGVQNQEGEPTGATEGDIKDLDGMELGRLAGALQRTAAVVHPILGLSGKDGARLRGGVMPESPVKDGIVFEMEVQDDEQTARRKQMNQARLLSPFGHEKEVQDADPKTE